MLELLLLLAQLSPAPAPPDSTEQQPAIVERARLDSSVINFRALVLPDTVYVGQQVTYQLGIFIDERVRDRVRHMEAVAPEMRAMLAYDAAAPIAGLPTRTEGSRRYEVHVYQRAIFPLAPGRFTIPPARLSYAMPLSFSFFSREENFELRSDSVVVVALPPPATARPPGYAGAVGALDVDARLDAGTARVGEPLTLTVRVSGAGNVKLLPRPNVAIPWASLVPAGERVSLAPNPMVVHGSKEFDWVLTPLKPGPVTLPSIRYPYFDPLRARYAVAATAPRVLTVAPGRLATIDSVPTVRPRWPIRTEYHGALPEPPYRRPPFWVLVALAPLPAAALVIARRPRRSRRRAEPAARRLRALAQHGSTAPPVGEVRRLLVHAMADRIRVPGAALAEPAALERAMRRVGTSRDTAASAAALLAELDAAAFSPAPRPVPDAAGRAYRLLQTIDAEARSFPASRASVVVVAALLCAASGAWALAATSAEATRFARGVDAYDHGRFGEAAGHFSWIAARVPRAADAWANLGTAAWEAGDTARAALGWERALRLDPLARDARDRLEQLTPATGGGPGAVPPVPARLVALLAAALWIGGWALAAVRLRRGPRGVMLPLVMVGMAVVLGLAAAELDARLQTRGLDVIAANQSLRLLPVLASEPSGSVRVGEVARLVERRGAWAHVRAADGRDGWIESTSLLPLGRE